MTMHASVGSLVGLEKLNAVLIAVAKDDLDQDVIIKASPGEYWPKAKKILNISENSSW